jgi:hypothetical protein
MAWGSDSSFWLSFAPGEEEGEDMTSRIGGGSRDERRGERKRKRKRKREERAKERACVGKKRENLLLCVIDKIRVAT